jgi:hypothetical protein
MSRSRLLAASFVGLIAAGTVVAALPDGVARVDRFARESVPGCVSGPATSCFDAGFRFADFDGSRGLSVAELDELRGDVLAWTKANRERLTKADRQGILATLAIVELAGLENIFLSYDEDRDGELSRAEALADLRLDDRPLPEIANDPEVVDWTRLRGRLGPAAALLDALRQN